MSLTLRVTRVRPCACAVAASSASITGKLPRAPRRPQISATSRSTGRTRGPNAATTAASQFSRMRARAELRTRSRSTPCRISPTTKTLRYSSSSLTPPYQAVTRESQPSPFRSSEITLVSIRYIRASLPSDLHLAAGFARSDDFDTFEGGCGQQRLEALAACSQPAILVGRHQHRHRFPVTGHGLRPVLKGAIHKLAEARLGFLNLPVHLSFDSGF